MRENEEAMEMQKVYFMQMFEDKEKEIAALNETLKSHGISTK